MSRDEAIGAGRQAGLLIALVRNDGTRNDRTGTEQRHIAMAQLQEIIREVARRAAARFPRRMRDDLVDDATSFVWERLPSFDKDKGRFEDWCFCILVNFYRDQVRKSGSGVVQSAAGGDSLLEPARGADDEDFLDRPDYQCMVKLRQVLDEMARGPEPSAQIDYHAVLLLQLRLVISRRLGERPRGGEPSGSDSLELVEWCLPWRPSEAESRVHPEWPTLRQVWQAVVQYAGTADARLDARSLVQIVDGMLVRPGSCTPDQWNQWVKRSKEVARRKVGDAALWGQLFQPLLPDRRSSRDTP